MEQDVQKWFCAQDWFSSLWTFLALLILLVISHLYEVCMDLFLLFYITVQDIMQYQYIQTLLLYELWSRCWKQTNKNIKCLAGKYAEIISALLCFIKNPFLLLQMGLITSYALWAASRTFGIFLLSRIVGGISKGNVSLSTAIIADLHSPKARSKGMVSYTCGVYVSGLLLGNF